MCPTRSRIADHVLDLAFVIARKIDPLVHVPADYRLRPLATDRMIYITDPCAPARSSTTGE